MQKNINYSACGCLQSKSASKSSKYCREIGAELIGNELLIKFQKEKCKPANWDPPCHCDGPASKSVRLPTKTQAPKIVNVGDNEIIFQISPKFQFTYDNNPHYKPQVITNEKDSHDQENMIKVTPHLEGLGVNHQVIQNHSTDHDHNSYMMNIQKVKSESIKDQRQNKRNIELEIVYPKKKYSNKIK